MYKQFNVIVTVQCDFSFLSKTKTMYTALYIMHRCLGFTIEYYMMKIIYVFNVKHPVWFFPEFNEDVLHSM